MSQATEMSSTRSQRYEAKRMAEGQRQLKLWTQEQRREEFRRLQDRCNGSADEALAYLLSLVKKDKKRAG